MMIILWIITGVALLVSLAADRRKTQAAVFKGLKMFVGVIPLLLGVLAAVSLVFFVDDSPGDRSGRSALCRFSGRHRPVAKRLRAAERLHLPWRFFRDEDSHADV
jgi:hypothetical protein